MQKSRLIWIMLILSAVIQTSCDSDDDVVLPQIVFNEFCYGPDQEIFVSDAGYSNDIIMINTDTFNTPIKITDANFSLNNNNLEGSGFLLELSFYGNRAQGFQEGIYNISNDQEVGNVIAGYNSQFDSNNLNPLVNFSDGYVILQAYRNGYVIEVNATDFNGDGFHGIFAGPIIPLD
ncbi:hypothetical protein [Nonlabens xiamenensis]|uniref:hypothetical protein n=1 Tax=Nonlabens xiamenensis TaxID=2341043 RepID=UPI000F6083BC|nr:hypothetical protein [Nonlabens xiamenensis]